MGKNKSKHLPLININQSIESHQSRRKEKYDLFLAIRDDQEERVIHFMKTNPWTLKCMFWFETYVHRDENIFEKTYVYNYREGKIVEIDYQCRCSQDFELGFNKNISQHEILKRLELSIAYGMCPHVVLDKKGLNVTYDQDIGACDVFNNFMLNENHKEQVRQASKPHGGIYWIHLAILFGKVKMIAELLPFCVKCGIKAEDMFTVRHQISPIVLAVARQQTVILEHLAMTFPNLVGDGPSNDNKDSEPALCYNDLQLALHKNQFKDFKILFHYYSLKDCFGVTESRLWADKIEECFLSGNTEDIHTLLSVGDIHFEGYTNLFRYVYWSGCYWVFNMIVEETDFITRFVKQQKSYNKKILNEIMIRAVFTGDSSIVKLFTDNGFNKNASFYKYSALAWAEGLGHDETVQVLRQVKSTARYHPKRSYSMIFCVIDHKTSNEIDGDFNLLRIIHHLCEHGQSLEGERSPLRAAWERNQNHVVKYLLFRGTNCVDIIPILRWSSYDFVREFSRFVYLMISTNQMISVYTMLKLYEVMYKPDLDCISLAIINEISYPDVNIPREQFSIKKIDITRWPDSLFEEMMEWCSKPRPLTFICRRVLRLHYKGVLFLRFIRSVRHMVPKATYNFLKMDDILSLISHYVDIKDMDEQTAEVDQYLL